MSADETQSANAANLHGSAESEIAADAVSAADSSAATTLRSLIRQAWPMRNDYLGVRLMLRSLIVRARRLERGEG